MWTYLFLACHPNNLSSISTKNTCVLFTLGTWCISCYFCSAMVRLPPLQQQMSKGSSSQYPTQVLLIQVRVDQGVMTMKRNSRSPECSLVSYPRHPFFCWGGLTPLQEIQSAYSKPRQKGQGLLVDFMTCQHLIGYLMPMSVFVFFTSSFSIFFF